MTEQDTKIQYNRHNLNENIFLQNTIIVDII